jgi:glycosyltransferase involved in cell wall biosynthesis
MRRRILHVTPYSDAAWAYGGIPRVVGALTRSLARSGHSVTVCATDVCDERNRLPRQTVESARSHGPGEITQKVFRNISNRLAYRQQVFFPSGFRNFMRRHAGEFDVAHLHACRNLPTLLASRYLKRAQVPYVVQPNGTAPVIERHQFAKRIFDFAAGNNLLAAAARVLAVSPAERDQLIALGVPDRSIRIIGNPIDLGEFSAPIPHGEFRREWGIGGDPLVLFLGKITPRKNLDTLVGAFAQLASSGARLVIAGNDMGGGDRARRLAHELQIANRTTFTGLLTGGSRLRALTDADVVVYASEHEIFGLVPFEALLCGTPVVVAGDSGCGDLIGATGGGVVVPVNDAISLARAIDGVLAHNDAWRIKAQHAQRHVRETYGDAVVGGALEGVYEEVISEYQNNRDTLKSVPYRSHRGAHA